MKILQFTLICLILFGCSESYKEINSADLSVQDIEIFKNTPVWELAKAIDKQRISKINKILTDNPELADFQEPIFGTTLLMRAISSEKYKSTKALLENGANPNIVARIGSFAFYGIFSFFGVEVDFSLPEALKEDEKAK